MSKDATMQPQLKYLGVDKWVNAGFTGNNVTVWCSEPINSDHGSKSAQMLLDVAPGINRITGTLTRTFKGDTLTSCTVTDDQKSDVKLSLEEFIAKYRPHIISSSNKGSQTKEWTNYIKSLQDKYNFVIFNCAYNDGDNAEHESITCRFPIEQSIIIGALQFMNGSPKRAAYSSVGKELDFSQLTGWWSGTSAATPIQAAMAAIIMSRYGPMSQTEMYKYLQMISIDLDKSGHDVYTGWGQPVLPVLGAKYITMTTKDTRYYVNGLAHTMDTIPINKEGNVFVPIRFIATALGANVDWVFNTDKSIRVSIENSNINITLNSGSDIALVNGKKMYLNFAPFIDENNRTLVPIRFIAEALNCKVDWVQRESKVMILSQK